MPAPVADAMREQGASKARNGAAPPSAPAAEAAADSAYDGIARQSIGTGHGEREWSPVGRTDFERASRTPAQVTQLRYDDIETLAALGIVPRPYYRDRRDGPVAFPNGFVADPASW
jgi:hypothetical protein